MAGGLVPKVDNFGAAEQPRLVFVHGFLDDGSFWRGVADSVRCVSRSHLTIIDLPGMGSRASDEGEFGLLRLSQAVQEEIANHEGPIVLIGHSMGAQIAELVARDQPDKIAGMVLVSPVPLGGLPLPEEMLSAMRQVTQDGASQREMRSQLLYDLSEGRLDEMVDVGLKVKPKVANALLDAWRHGVPAGRERTEFNGPTLVIGGASDGFSTPELLETQILPRFPGAQLVLTNEAGHWPHVEQPAAIAAEIDRFVGDLRL